MICLITQYSKSGARFGGATYYFAGSTNYLSIVCLSRRATVGSVLNNYSMAHAVSELQSQVVHG